MLLFMLESGMMGIVASILGWLVGFVSIVLIAGSAGVGTWLRTLRRQRYSGPGTLGGSGAHSTILATIAPAVRAAQMPAAMALRSEV